MASLMVTMIMVVMMIVVLMMITMTMMDFLCIISHWKKLSQFLLIFDKRLWTGLSGGTTTS